MKHGNSTRPPRKSGFQLFAETVGLSEEEAANFDALLPRNFESHSIVQDLIQKSARSPNVLFFFDGACLMQYGSLLSIGVSSLHSLTTQERIKGKNEVVDPSASLNTENLRSIFVLLEALVYKCVHLKLLKLQPDYKERTEAYERRLQRLVDAKLLSVDERRLALELYDTRCQFAHSVKPAEYLQYMSKPLRERWGQRGVMNPSRLKRLFLPDAFKYSEKLLQIFKPVQAHQIDCSIFKSEVKKFIRSKA